MQGFRLQTPDDVNFQCTSVQKSCCQVRKCIPASWGETRGGQIARTLGGKDAIAPCLRIDCSERVASNIDVEGGPSSCPSSSAWTNFLAAITCANNSWPCAAQKKPTGKYFARGRSDSRVCVGSGHQLLSRCGLAGMSKARPGRRSPVL